MRLDNPPVENFRAEITLQQTGRGSELEAFAALCSGDGCFGHGD
jgi:hypothetical protein